MLIRFVMPPALAASRSLAALLVALLAATTLAGCQKTQEAMADSTTARAGGVQLQAAHDGGGIPLRDEHGAAALRSGDALPLPENFPDDVFLPDNYRINSVMNMGGTQVISLQAPGQVSGLFGAARDAMDRQGWTQQMSMQNSTDTALLTYEKDKRAAVLSFNSDRSRQAVIMSLQLRSSQ